MGLWKALEQQNVTMIKRQPRREKTEQTRSTVLRMSKSSSLRLTLSSLARDILGEHRRQVTAPVPEVLEQRPTHERGDGSPEGRGTKLGRKDW